MSKIGKKIIEVPEGVSITSDIEMGRDIFRVKGPKGELLVHRPANTGISVEDGKLTTSVSKTSKQARANWGTAASLIKNAIEGVTNGFEKGLIFEGVGYRATMKGNDIELSVGYSHPVLYKAPEGVLLSTEKNTIKVNGIDRAIVGQVAAEIRKIRKPEPYKGSGIRYAGEVIRRKAGKKAVGSGE
jgi:large subunit ribosomal protein L6